jgi:spermidine synthase
MNDSPRLHRNSQTISLSFESSLIQSAMRLEAPDELVLDYTRAMMGFLLLLQPTAQAAPAVLMIGLGGGSMLKYLHANLPGADLSTVEIHPEVIDMRQDFHIPPDSERLRIICADGAAFVARPTRLYDVILVDGFTGGGLPDALCSRGFYAHCRKALAPGGVLVANVQADTLHTNQIRQRLSKAFGPEGAALWFESDEGGNDIAMASADRRVLEQARDAFEARWHALPLVHQATLAAASTRLQRALMRAVPPQAGAMP